LKGEIQVFHDNNMLKFCYILWEFEMSFLQFFKFCKISQHIQIKSSVKIKTDLM